MSDLKKLVAQFMSELAKFEATTAQAPIAADEFSPEELADLTKVRNMGAKIRAKIAATAKPNAEMLAKSAAPEKNSESFEEIYQNYLNDCASGNLTHEKFEVHKKNLQAIVTTEKKAWMI